MSVQKKIHENGENLNFAIIKIHEIWISAYELFDFDKAIKNIFTRFKFDILESKFLEENWENLN